MSDTFRHLRVPASGKEDEANWAAGNPRWVRDADHGYVACSIVSDNDDTVDVKLSGGQTKTVSSEDVERMNPPKFDRVEDMAQLTHLNEASVLHNLRERYHSDLIYTYSGLFCVVVNPYKNIPIYTEKIVAAFKGQKRGACPPHVFAVADQAYRDMLHDRVNQSILCTGESGAGKTENTKKVIQYLAHMSSKGTKGSSGNRGSQQSLGQSTVGTGSHEQDGLEKQLLQANPILETFGNAATTKNDNSSRFGKLIKIHFDSAGYITGASIDTYLLEKSRGVFQGEKERNFHCFYQLLRGANSSYIKEMLLEDVQDSFYLTNGKASVPGIDDAREFAATNEAFKIMGLSDEEILPVWKVVASVLHLGKLIQTVSADRAGEQAVIKDDQAAQKVAHLLGINHRDFTRALLKPKVKAGSDFVVKKQNKEQVDFAIEALSKAIYERLFLWIVRRINQSLDQHVRDSRSFIGILDIAGFEIFKINSFEQLCINYTNEKLQQLFNRRMFVLEQEEYQREGIQWDHIDFGLDLQGTIDLIEKNQPPGVLSLLEEQCLFPKATDKSFVDKLSNNLKNNNKYEPAQFKEDGDFAIHHYAGRVLYQAKDWIMKNKDPVNDNAVALLEKSSDPFVAELWTNLLVRSGPGRAKKGSFRTVGSVYKDQLASLMETLESTTPNFVRCIIPNHKKKAGLIDAGLVLDQLRCNGVLEGIRIVRKGFPNRIIFSEFIQRYKLLTPEVSASDDKRCVEQMMKVLVQETGIQSSSYSIGRTKIFFRAGELAKLEEGRDRKLSDMILGLQAYARGYLARKYHGVLIHGSNAIVVIQRNARAYIKLREWPWWRLFTKVKPLLKVARGDEELRTLKEELEKWKERAQKEEQARQEVEQKRNALLEETRSLNEKLQIETDALNEAEEIRQRLTRRKAELEAELEDLEQQHDAQMEQNAQWLEEKKELMTEIGQLKELVSEGMKKEGARVEQLERNVEEQRKQCGAQQKLVDELKASTDSVKAELSQLQNELDEASTRKAKAEKQRKKLQAQMEDMSVNLDRERQEMASFNAKQRTFDKQLAEEETRLQAIEAEKEAAKSSNLELETSLLKLKNDLEELSTKYSAAEKKKKRLQEELDEVMENQQDKSVAEAEAKIRQLTIVVEEQTIQIEECKDDLEDAEGKKVTLEKQFKKLEQQLVSQDGLREEEEEEKRRALQKELHVAEEELETERRARSKCATERRKLELELQTLQENLDEESRLRSRAERMCKKLEKKLELLRGQAEEDAAVGESASKEVEKLKKKVADLKEQLLNLDDDVTQANREKRRAARHLEDSKEHVEHYEKEISNLRQQLRRARQADESST